MPQDLEKRIFSHFNSRRSTVHSTKGIIACSQPLAARAGQIVLEKGGNAADAAVAVAAALNVTEPCSTGIGGDAFCLFYDAKTKKVLALNGSGRAPAAATLERVKKELGFKEGDRPKIPLSSPLAVSVPGAAAAWVDTVERYGSGKLSLLEILTPAITLAEDGYPVSDISSYNWLNAEAILRSANPDGCDMLQADGKSPRPGQVFRNPNLGKTFRLLAEHGKKGFYEGEVAEATVKALQQRGGFMTLDDLKHHAEAGTQNTEAVSLDYDVYPDEPVRLWEHPPNGQGLVALIALGIIQELQRSGRVKKFGEGDHNSVEYIHVLAEALRIAFADGAWFVADPDVTKVPVKDLISKEYLAERAKLFDEKTASQPKHGSPAQRSSETVYLSVTDAHGNGCSFINSNYNGFGTGIIPSGYGFTLQNRAAGFDLIEGHPNVVEPRKRPYHTIIPPMITDPRDDSLFAVYGVMGGFMQPQGHVQVLFNMLAFGMTPQAALDAPRMCLGAGTEHEGDPVRTVNLEEGISEGVAEGLRALGHDVVIVKGFGRGLFGRGQVIRSRLEDGKPVYSGGSDQRGDGHAVPML